MKLGKKKFEIEIKSRSYIFNIIIGLIAVMMPFVNRLTNRDLTIQSIVGLNFETLLIIAGGVTAFSALKKVRALPKEPRIEICENGIRYGHFESTFKNLDVSTKGNKFVLDNGSETIIYKHVLSSQDYSAIKGNY